MIQLLGLRGDRFGIVLAIPAARSALFRDDDAQTEGRAPIGKFHIVGTFRSP